MVTDKFRAPKIVLVLVAVLVIGSAVIEDENENDDGNFLAACSLATGRGSLFSRRSGCRCAGRPVRLGSAHDMVDPGLARNDPASVVPRLERLFPLWHEQPGGGEESELSGRPQPPRRVGLHGGGGGLREGPGIQPALRGGTP